MANLFRAAASAMRTRASLGGAVYAGAAGGRLHYDWLMSELSADYALRGSIRTLRDRARELVLSNTTASAVPQILSENVVGKDGILYQAAVRTDAGDFDKATNAAIETAWYRWCEAPSATVDKRNAWPEVESLITENEAIDGEVLIRLVRGFDNAFGFALDLLDPDQLDHTLNLLPGAGQNRVSMGVELDAWGAPVAYHCWSNHPSEGRRQRVRIPADEIIHLFVQRRPKQSRGVSWFAPAIVDLRMHGAYRTAEVIAARTAAAKQGFFEVDPEKYTPPEDGDEDRDTDGTLPMTASAGALDQLPPGMTFKPWDPQHPNAVFPEFDKALLRSLATGFRVSYMSLSSDLNGTSFGSARVGMLAERAVYQKLQQRLIARVHGPVFRAWLRMALITGALRLPSFVAERYEAAVWHPRRFDWIDPEKDVNQRLTEVRAGTYSLTRMAAEKGYDLEELLQERQREIALAERYGVPLDLGARVPVPAPPADATDDGAPDDAHTPSGRRAREAPPMRLLGGRA